MKLDVNGNIVQQDGDGGDTAQRTGFVETGLRLRDHLGISNDSFLNSTPWRFEKQWPTLIVGGSHLIRNPISYNNPNDTSRDQTTPMISAFGLNQDFGLVRGIMPKGFFHKYPNADIASPGDMAHIDRALDLKPSWLGDVWNFFGIKVRCYQASKDPNDVGDDMNCFLSAAYAFVVSPTYQSKKNLKYYLVNRPKSASSDPDNVMGALVWYNRIEAGGNPDIAELWRPIVEALRSRVC